jgi:Ring finger domain
LGDRSSTNFLRLHVVWGVHASLLLFSIVVSWIILTFYFIMSFQKGELCDVPLRFWYWLVTLELVIDVFRNDIMRHVLRWDPAAQSPDASQRFIPARVVAYNIAYLAYAMLVLRMGINCVYIEGRQPQNSCRETAPHLFKSSAAFVTLELAAWATIILGYLVPFCFVATLLTLNGYTPGEPEDGARVGASPIPGGVFPSAYSTNGSPPGTVERLREIDVNDCDEQECCICMEDFRKKTRHNGNGAIVQTDCGHVLHKSCCSVWLRQARTCPVCRTDIPNAQAERLRQQQAELGDASQRNQQTAQERRQSPDHHRTAVAPHLPFRPAGRQEVATLIRAFRPPGRSGERRRSGQRREGSSQRSVASERSRRSFTDGSLNRRERSQSRQNEEPVGNIEITTMSRRTPSSGSIHSSEVNQSSNHPASGDNTGSIDFVL